MAIHAGLCGAGAQAMLSDNFNSSGDLDSFAQYNSSGTAYSTANGLQQASGVGTGGTGGVQYGPTTPGSATQISAIYTPTTFSLAGGTGYSFSMDFQKLANISASSASLQLGFTSASNKPLGASGTDFLGFQVLASTSTAQLRSLSGTAGSGSSASAANAGSSFAFAAASTDWFHLAVTLTLTNPATSQFTYTVAIYDIGPDGTGTPGTALASASGTLTNAAIASDPSLYFGFYSGRPDTAAIDNLSVSPVPEPGCVALFLGGMGTVLAFSLVRGKACRS